ncbi:ribE: riboflavin synthase, alpha subunit [Rubrobacter radiotolerans]|uniref:Riboflavin synthase n=1 Tax=Rubrobacter radiotolerans TaxID=42256 RepID=A0A023X3M8_RUBRA|nr:riboflavin synthase [Rubrobacter radiotolerans]AHY46654.1 ribE: riboflavin synthase, alpha subunit [Rubrobacter radiotolerans]MDX5894061.1 riboflavin synthase [Rubrobacter radiotolerans]SMC05089.1 riboflavin synthase alpha chain [Rubrobacter radiotolerans DSM 5868]
MFTGLVEETGRVLEVSGGGMLRLKVASSVAAADASPGDSISVNGVCLTVSEHDGESLVFYAMDETMRRTALGNLAEGSLVNLERAMSAQDRFGGHIVQGHVDGVGEVRSVTPEGDAELWEFSAPESVLRYTVEKGSICVDGISLTVVSVSESGFVVSILPQTKAQTDLSELGIGSRVNLEADVIGKYVERLVAPRTSRRTEEPADAAGAAENGEEPAEGRRLGREKQRS